MEVRPVQEEKTLAKVTDWFFLYLVSSGHYVKIKTDEVKL